MAIVKKKGALILKESQLDTEFKNTFAELISNDDMQNMLSKKIHKLALPNATKEIVIEIEKLIK